MMEDDSNSICGTNDDELEKLLRDVKDTINKSKSNSNEVLQFSNNDENNDENAQQNDDEKLGQSQTEIDSLKNQGLIEINDLLLIVNEFGKLRKDYKILQDTQTKSNNNNLSNENKISELEAQLELLKEENESLKSEISATKSIETNDTNNSELSDALQKTVERLENEVKEQKRLTTEANEKLTAHDAAAKRAIAVLKKEMGSKIEQVTKRYEESLSEKDAFIIKISKLEQLLDEIQHDKSIQSRKIGENQSELDNLRSILKSKDSDYIKLVTANETLEKDISKLNKKIETHTNDVDAQEMKVKWAQNKLKSEVDGHKETKKQISQLTAKLQEAKEEGNQIRKNCQEMIERYQGDEEIASVRLNKELEEQLKKLKQSEENITKKDQLLKKKDSDHELLKLENEKLSKELFESKTQVALFEGKNINLTQELNEGIKDCAEFKTKLETYKEQVKEVNDLKSKVKQYEQELKDLSETNHTIQQQLNEYEIELGESKTKQQEVLLYSQSLTENNVSSKAMATDLQYKLDSLQAEKDNAEAIYKKSEENFKQKIGLLMSEKKTLESHITELDKKIEDKTNTVNELSVSLEEAQDELKVLRKKNASQMKDLQRQLHQTTRKIEKLENSSKNGSLENLSIRSRTSSSNSLERPNESPPNHSPKLSHEPVMIASDHNIIQPNTNKTQQFQEIEVDKRVLLEKICKLQRLLAKKNEKIEFSEEHINQLTGDVQKKTKIIQYFISREEAGSLVPDKFDRNKADVSQHGCIMSSVYSAKPTDKGMTLELSLTINRKLQAVLEDTLLKNIMLKENINTLGSEIARLQTELKAGKS